MKSNVIDSVIKFQSPINGERLGMDIEIQISSILSKMKHILMHY